MNNIIIVDDHKIFADLTSEYLTNKRHNVLKTFYSGSDLLKSELLSEADFLLLDLGMPGVDGYEVLESIHNKYPDLKIVILTTVASPENLIELHKMNIDGYIHKSNNLDVLGEAIKTIESGKRYYSDVNFSDIIQSSKEKVQNHELTPREYEIANLLSKGLNPNHIAKKLFISIHTVRAHKKALFKKFEVNSVKELIKYVVRKNIV